MLRWPRPRARCSTNCGKKSTNPFKPSIAMKKKLIKQALFYTVLLALWMILARLKIWPPYLLPDPKGVWDSLSAGFADHSFWIGIWVSMRRIAVGYGISIVLGTTLGMCIAGSKFLEDTVGGLLVSLQSLP